MGSVAQNLADIVAAVGEDNIAFLPSLDDVEFSPQSQIQKAFQFKLLYGTASTASGSRQVWLYLFAHTDRDHKLQFGLSSHNGNELKVWFQGDRPMIEIKTIGKVRAIQRAFQDVIGLNKIQGLAKYLFLIFVVQDHCKDNLPKVPFNVARTWVANLREVCSDFQLLVTKENEK